MAKPNLFHAGPINQHDQSLMESVLTERLMHEYEAAKKDFGTDDLVCVAARNGLARQTLVSFNTRQSWLDMPQSSHPGLPRMQKELALTARAKAEQSGAPPHNEVFWLVAGTPNETEPLIAVVATFPMARGGGQA